MPGSDLAATLWDQTSGGGAQYEKVAIRWVFLDAIAKIGGVSLDFAQ